MLSDWNQGKALARIIQYVNSYVLTHFAGEVYRDCILFRSTGMYVNIARIDIARLAVVRRSGTRWIVASGTSVASARYSVAISAGRCIGCHLVYPISGGGKDRTWAARKIIVQLHSQELELTMSRICTAFGLESMHGDYYNSSIGFGTKSGDSGGRRVLIVFVHFTDCCCMS